MFSLGDWEGSCADITSICRLIWCPISCHQSTIPHFFSNLRLLLEVRNLQFTHAQLNAELLERLLIFVVFFPQPIKVRFGLFKSSSFLAMLADFYLQLRDGFFILELLRLQCWPPFSLNSQVSFRPRTTLFTCYNLWCQCLTCLFDRFERRKVRGMPEKCREWRYKKLIFNTISCLLLSHHFL